MDVYEKVKNFLEEKAGYWYVAAGIFLALETANYGFLSLTAPGWVCACVTLVLILAATFYTAVMYRYARKRYQEYRNRWKADLFNRVESLENHINDLHEKNMELENLLAEAVQKNTSDCMKAAETEIISTVGETSEAVKAEIHGFKVDLDARLNDDVRNLHTRISEGFEAQEDLAKRSEEELRGRLGRMETGLTETIQTCSDRQSSNLEQLSRKMEDFRREEAAGSGRIIETVHEQTAVLSDSLAVYKAEQERQFLEQDAVIKESAECLEGRIAEASLAGAAQAEELAGSIEALKINLGSDTDLMTQLLKELGERVTAAGKEGRELTAKEAARIIDQAKENRESEEALLQEQKNRIETMEAGLNEALRNGFTDQAGSVSELSSALEYFRKNEEDSAEELKDMVKEASQTIAQKLDGHGERREEQFREQNTLIQTVAGRIEILASDERDAQSANQKQLTELGKQITALGIENREAVTNGTEKLLAALEENRMEQERQHEEQKKTILFAAAGVEETLGEASSLSLKASDDLSERLSEIKNVVHESTQQLSAQAFNGQEKIAETLNEIKNKENENSGLHASQIHNLDLKLDQKLAKISLETRQSVEAAAGKITASASQGLEAAELRLREQGTSLVNAVKSVENMINEAAGIEQAQIDRLEKTISSAEQAAQIRDRDQESLLKKLGVQIADSASLTARTVDQLDDKVSQMQKNLMKLLAQILDQADEESEKTYSAYNRIFDLVLDFSKTTKRNLETMRQGMEVQRHVAEEKQRKNEAVFEEQLSCAAELKQKVDAFTIAADRSQGSMTARLDQLQNQIVNLARMAEVFRNLSEASGARQSRQDPNRTETFQDPETGFLVKNVYKSDQLASSEMINGKKLVYRLEYDNKGQIKKSTNYDGDGKPVTELQYYPNGEVMTRVEQITIGGRTKKVTTKFDEKGNKLG